MHMVRHDNPGEGVDPSVIMQSAHFIHHVPSTIQIGKITPFPFGQYRSYEVSPVFLTAAAFA